MLISILDSGEKSGKNLITMRWGKMSSFTFCVRIEGIEKSVLF
jgi:hypothetical protein